jgi:hypothetical protein
VEETGGTSLKNRRDINKNKAYRKKKDKFAVWIVCG